jgi:hypothetical protein
VSPPFWRRVLDFFRPVEDSAYDSALIDETPRDTIIRAVIVIVSVTVTWTVLDGFSLHGSTVAEGFGLSCLFALIQFVMRRRERRELLAWRREARGGTPERDR